MSIKVFSATKLHRVTLSLDLYKDESVDPCFASSHPYLSYIFQLAVYFTIIPISRWLSVWQWWTQVPGLSTDITNDRVCAGSTLICQSYGSVHRERCEPWDLLTTSTRCCAWRSVFPCQCGVWTFSTSPSASLSDPSQCEERIWFDIHLPRARLPDGLPWGWYP